MRHYLTWPRAAFAAGGVFLIAASFNGALAITETGFNYTNPRVGNLAINGMAMIPTETATAQNYSVTGSGGVTTTTDGCFSTGVNLPNGALIQQLSVWYQNGDIGAVSPALVRVTNSTGVTVVFASGQNLPGRSGIRRPANIPVTASPESTIDNASFSYGLRVCMAPDDTFYMARIRYTYTNAGS